MKILAIGDTHFPYVDRKALDRVYDFAERKQPDIIVQMGDLYDLYNFSRYPKSLEVASPRTELRKAIAAATEMWLTLHALCPDARRVQLLGNHDDRISKQILGKAPEMEGLLDVLDFQRIWRFEGVTTAPSSDQEVVIKHPTQGEIWFHHGHRSRIGDHAIYNQANTVTGHLHKGGAVFKGYRDRTRWELNAGYIADQTKKPLQYNAQKYADTTPGMGYIDDDGPRFIPFPRPRTKVMRVA